MKTLSRRTRGTALGLALVSLLPSCFWGLSDEQEKALSFYNSQAQYWVDKQRFREARQQAQKGLEIDPDHYELNRLMGYCLVMIGEPETIFASTDYLDRCSLGWFESDWKLDMVYGLAYHRQAKVYQLAIEDMRRKVAASRDPVEKSELGAKILDFQAKMAERYENAIGLFEEIAEDQDNHDVAVDNLAQIHANLRQYDRSLYWSEILIRNASLKLLDNENFLLNPDLPAAEEERVLDTSRRIKIRMAEVRGLRANIFFEQGRFEESIAELDEILERLDTSRIAEFFNRAEAKKALGDFEGAKQDYYVFLRRSVDRADPERLATARQHLKELGVDIDRLIEIDVERLRTRSTPDLPEGERSAAAVRG